MLVIRNQEV